MLRTFRLFRVLRVFRLGARMRKLEIVTDCLLYTSDAADE